MNREREKMRGKNFLERERQTSGFNVKNDTYSYIKRNCRRRENRKQCFISCFGLWKLGSLFLHLRSVLGSSRSLSLSLFLCHLFFLFLCHLFFLFLFLSLFVYWISFVFPHILGQLDELGLYRIRQQTKPNLRF